MPEQALNQTMDPTTARLVQQVEILNSTLETSLQRLDTAFNLFQDRASELKANSDSLQVVANNMEIALEALHRAISESDAQLDDLAKITARIGQMELTYQQALQGAQQAQK